jgi:hypothetical protein
MTEPISIMLPYDNRPKVVTISAELSDAQVALLRAAERVASYEDGALPELRHCINQVLRAGGGK